MARLIPQPIRLTGESADLIKAINGESPLACALIVEASLEKALLSLLGKFFIESEEAGNLQNAVLGSFTRCVDLAYCLGLISKGMLDNLKLFGRIRNVFAHSHRFIDFDDESTRDLCMKLRFPNISQGVAVDGGDPTPLEKWAATPRDRFSLIGVLSFHRLLLSALSTEPRKPLSDYFDEEQT